MIERVYGNIPESAESLIFPKSIDINPTALCNLACSFCWGPDHTIPDGLDTDQWKGVIDFFADRGTDAIVFTGGEPLIRKDLIDLISHAKERDMRVTLSTNTLLLPRYASQVLPLIDEIGIPLDGSSPEKNSRMRLGNKKSFDAAVAAIDFVKPSQPNIEVTIRTVVSKVNCDDIIDIGGTLQQRAQAFDRWKLYQFTPLSIGAGHIDEHDMGVEQFTQIVDSVLQSHPTLPIISYPFSQQPGRYVFVGPQGNIYGIGGNGSEHRITGNYLTDTTAQIESNVQLLFDLDKNSSHAHA